MPLVRTYQSFADVRQSLVDFLLRHELEHNMLLAFVESGEESLDGSRVLALAYEAELATRRPSTRTRSSACPQADGSARAAHLTRRRKQS